MPFRAVLVAAGLGLCAFAQQASDLDFLTSHVDGRELTRMLPQYLKAKAEGQISRRRAETARISTLAQLAERRRLFRERFTRALGGFPDRTPLNPRVTGAIDMPGYRIEKVIFESRPGFHVTANLYLPKSGRAPHPAILFPLGHEAGAKAHDAWQHVLVTFARRGYVCLAWDTLGQGERIQVWDEDFQESKLVRSTTEHTILGLQTLLAGDPLAQYTIWDGIRALDYLLSRPEVDPKRVGVTGNSGGGTHTAYLASLDDRFAAAAPSCYITSWQRLLDTIGPQDAEQCIPPFLADGLDHADFILAAAPKPYLMLTAIRDFFSIEGARATAAEVSRIYDSAGYGDRFGKFEADDGHGYTSPRRLAAYRFFSKWLEGSENTSPEGEVRVLGERELWATRSGQVVTEFQAETVFTLNQKRLARFKPGGATLDSVKSMVGFAPRSGPPRIRAFGAAGAVERFTYEAEPGIDLPALLYLPPGEGRKPAVVFADGRGKAAAHPEALKLAAGGAIVLSVDLRGLGETRPASLRSGSDWPRYFGDYESAMTAMLTGKPLVAMRAEDISRAVDVLLARPDVDPSRVSVRGRELAAVPALYAAAFDTRISSVRLERMIESYASITRHRIHRNQWENAVPGALRHFDLPDLVRFVSPRKVEVVDPLNPLGFPVLQPSR